MEMFLQAVNESIVINDDITVTVLEIKGDEVVLGIEAPEWLHIEEQAMGSALPREMAAARYDATVEYALRISATTRSRRTW